jgi:hypothetical protein
MERQAMCRLHIDSDFEAPHGFVQHNTENLEHGIY